MNQNTILHARHLDLKPKNNEFLCILNGNLNNISARPAFSKLRSSLIFSSQNQEINVANRHETNTNLNQDSAPVNNQAFTIRNVANQIMPFNTEVRIITDEISKFYMDLNNFLNKSDPTKENENLLKSDVLENEFEFEENGILGIKLFSENNKYFTYFKLESDVSWNEIIKIFVFDEEIITEKEFETEENVRKNDIKTELKVENVAAAEQKFFLKKDIELKMEILKEKSKKDDFIEAKKFLEGREKEFAIFCCKELRKLKKCKSFKKIIKKLKSFCYSKPDEYYFNTKNVSSRVYDLISYLEENALSTEGIFRLTTDKKIYTEIPKLLANDKFFNFKDFSIEQNACILKGYIRDVLNGLFPACVSEVIVEISQEHDIFNVKDEIVKRLWQYLPFTCSSEERNLLQRLFQLWEKIDSNKKLNKMNICNLAICFGPSLFPANIVSNIYQAKEPANLALMLYCLDLDKIDPEIVRLYKNKK
ncbi:Rho GTPase-activating protein 1 [Gurleya vavrai]